MNQERIAPDAQTRRPGLVRMCASEQRRGCRGGIIAATRRVWLRQEQICKPSHGDEVTSRLDKTDRSPGKGAAAMPGTPAGGVVEDSFDGDFAKLKLRVIRPAFDALATWLKERGNGVEISEEPGGSISMHIVPAGVDRSTRTLDRFPTFSVLGSSLTRTIALQARNMRPDSGAASGSRSVYALAKISTALVEAELMKFVDEMGKW
jgi:hypothetical protein